jgi:hypothetical protein
VSIYASWSGLDCEHEDGCAFWVEVSDGLFERGSEADCTCGLPRAPLIYQGSHVLPSADDPKGGYVEIASIPDHITRPGRDDGGEGPKDWLRLSVGSVPLPGEEPREAESDSLVLTRKQVEIVRDEMTEWLDRKPEGAE